MGRPRPALRRSHAALCGQSAHRHRRAVRRAQERHPRYGGGRGAGMDRAVRDLPDRRRRSGGGAGGNGARRDRIPDRDQARYRLQRHRRAAGRRRGGARPGARPVSTRCRPGGAGAGSARGRGRPVLRPPSRGGARTRDLGDAEIRALRDRQRPLDAARADPGGPARRPRAAALPAAPRAPAGGGAARSASACGWCSAATIARARSSATARPR